MGICCVNDTVSWEKVQSNCKAAEMTSDIDTVPEDNDIDCQHPTKRVRRYVSNYEKIGATYLPIMVTKRPVG